MGFLRKKPMQNEDQQINPDNEDISGDSLKSQNNELTTDIKSTEKGTLKNVENKLNSFINGEDELSKKSEKEIKKIFGKVKEINEKSKENRKKREEQKLIEKQQRKEKLEKKMISRFNIYRGIKFKVYYPEEEIVLKQHSGLTKGLATFTFGLPGYAVTSGTKEQKKQKSIITIVQVVDAGVIFKNASPDGKDIRIPFDNIISFKEYKGAGVKNRIGGYAMTLIGNQKLELYFHEVYYKERKRLGDDLNCVFDHIEKAIDDKATGSLNSEEIKWNSNSTKSLNENTMTDSKQSPHSLIEDIEKLGNLYEKGLLTEEEFNSMKQNLLSTDNNNISNNNENTPKFCGNCGTEIISDSNFCINCGTKIN